MLDSTPKASFIEKLLFLLFFIAIFAVLANSIYQYRYGKDFTILVETSCDSTLTSCYVRDCETEECPPNGLSEYRVFSVAAKDFSKCTDDPCLFECSNNVISCTEIVCDPTKENVCSE